MIVEFVYGDVVTCKQSLFNNRGGFIFEKNKTYVITYADYWNLDETVIAYSIKTSTMYQYNDDYSKKQNFKHTYKFSDYFYSKSELRGYKLLKLDNELS